MNLNLLTKFLSLGMGAGLLLLSACSSTPRTQEEKVVAVAKQEARRQGWKRLDVYSCRFVDGRWLVGIVRRPTKVVGTDAIVEVSAEGKVMSFNTSRQ